MVQADKHKLRFELTKLFKRKEVSQQTNSRRQYANEI